MSELQLRCELVRLARSLHERGYSAGSSGNISVRLADGVLMTPTNASLGALQPDRLSKLDAAWQLVSGDPPSKEIFLHRAFYESRPATGAIVHLHSTYGTALSCLADTDPNDCVPALTPYIVMRLGTVRLIPYVRPGDPGAGDFIRELRGNAHAVLLSNHGSVVAGKDLMSAGGAAEELEQAAKLLLTLRGLPVRLLSADQVSELNRIFAS
jgi:ribulose-5-phosphate 4-epimerase/fuculose-1-phosphate aldolase